MTKLTVDETLRSKLGDFTEQVECCDEQGKTLGHFLPAALFSRLLREWAEAQISDEELERRRKDPVRYTTEEVLAYLKSL